MIGHTERATVNKRRPLTPAMRAVLELLRMRDIPQYGQDQGDKSRLRALMDRGYAIPCRHEGKGVWRITEAGRAAS